MKNLKKMVICVIILSMILTVTAYASSIGKWSKQIDGYEYEEKTGVLVIETKEGCFLIEFDENYEFVGIIEIDEDGTVDEEYFDYDCDEPFGSEIVGISFFHN